MKNLQIESLEDLKEFLQEKSVNITNSIKEGIEQAINNNKKTALLFEIEVEGMDTSFEISLTSKEWVKALENCLKHYTEWSMADDAIDTWILIKELKLKNNE
jgi:hypothetical protein